MVPKIIPAKLKPTPFPWPKKKALNAALSLCVNTKGFGFFDGGCRIFAEAICQVIPKTKIATILVSKKPDHYGVILPNDWWADFDGPTQSWITWAERYRVSERISRRIDVVDFLQECEEIPQDPSFSKEIAKILKVGFIA